MCSWWTSRVPLLPRPAPLSLPPLPLRQLRQELRKVGMAKGSPGYPVPPWAIKPVAFQKEVRSPVPMHMQSSSGPVGGVVYAVVRRKLRDPCAGCVWAAGGWLRAGHPPAVVTMAYHLISYPL